MDDPLKKFLEEYFKSINIKQLLMDYARFRQEELDIATAFVPFNIPRNKKL